MTEQTQLKSDLDACREHIYAKAGTLTQEHAEPIRQRVLGLMAAKGWVLESENIEVEMSDKTEFVDVTVRVGRASALLPLKWERANGTVAVRIDTDGDGL